MYTGFLSIEFSVDNLEEKLLSYLTKSFREKNEK